MIKKLIKNDTDTDNKKCNSNLWQFFSFLERDQLILFKKNVFFVKVIIGNRKKFFNTV